MILRLFYVFLALCIAYMSYEALNLYSLRSATFKPFDGQYIGPDDADLTVVEFVNYTCIYCQESHSVITEAVERDGNVKLIPRSILSSEVTGTTSTYLVQAAANQNMFWDAHSYLLDNPQIIENEDDLQRVSNAIGLDYDTLYADMASNEVRQRVQTNHQMFVAVSHATPTFLFGPKLKLIPSEDMPSVEDYLKLFAEARSLQ